MTKYLAWGGDFEDADTPLLLGSDDVANLLESSHYTGLTPFAGLAEVKVVDGDLTVTRVETTRAGTTTDEQDYLHTTYDVVPVDGGPAVDRVTVRIDGRA
ncbi:hypothetical protein ACG83_10110 [Frankia sp. R43]|uniref:hypothetical protein n=1 Tax=Frankia sp. R43 TaxID=269536 RepID=UPI0006CA5C02|nr:hypothetical protein [Frankia sp. R43]KPM55637.1 hypothetical protein ACG83_10110 [Frankia sp. R43]